MPGLDLKLPPPVVGALVAGAMWAAAGPVPDEVSLLRGLLAGALAAAGLAFDLGGLLAFRTARTTVNPLHPQRSTALVTGGVYRVTRNPMYLGLALLLSAWAVVLGGAWPWAGPVAFVATIGRFQIRPEERALHALFGADYAAYCRRVRRWL